MSDFVKKSGIADKVKHRKLIIPAIPHLKRWLGRRLKKDGILGRAERRFPYPAYLRTYKSQGANCSNRGEPEYRLQTIWTGA